MKTNKYKDQNKSITANESQSGLISETEKILEKSNAFSYEVTLFEDLVKAEVEKKIIEEIINIDNTKET